MRNCPYKVKGLATLAVVALTIVFGSLAQGSPNTITFQSRIVKPDGFPLEAVAVTFRMNITDTVGSCVIYQEDFTNRNMSGSKGLINLSLGAGAKVFPAGPMTMIEVFNNYGSPTLNCLSGGSINAGTTDRRKLQVQFHDGSGWQTVPAMDINSNPFALQAVSAHKLGDFDAVDYLRTATLPTCAGGQALHFNGTSITCVAVAGGGGTVTNVSSPNTDIGVATGGSTPVLTLNSSVAGAADKIVKLDGSGNFGAINAAALTNLNASALATGTVPDARMPALTGDVTMAAGATVTAIAAGVIVDADINAGAAIDRTKIAVAAAGATRGDLLMNDATTGAIVPLGCADTQIIKFDASGVATCAADNNGVASGTTNRIPRYTSATALGDSAITDNGTTITATRSIAAVTNTVAAAAVNLGLSNTHTLNTVGGAAITITNPSNGGVYNIIVTDAASRTYTFTGCTNSFYRPANAATTAATRTIYGLMTVDIGGGNWDCYITWSSGFAPPAP